jgi:hypothetical protein
VRLIFLVSLLSISLIGLNQGGGNFKTLNDTIDAKELQEDLTQIRDILLGTHPNPFVYTSRNSWDSTYLKLLYDFRNQQSGFDFFYKTSIWVNQLKDSHVGFNLGDINYYYNFNEPWFDFNLERIDSKFYSDYFFQNAIPYGSEILKINFISVDSIFRTALVFSPQEGDSFEAKKRYATSIMNLIFNFKFKNKIQDSKIPIEYVNWEGDTIFTYLKATDIKEQWHLKNNNYLKSKDVEYEINEKENYGILRVNSFLPVSVANFEDTIDSFFHIIEKLEISKILIDIRNNEGGYFDCVNFLYKYIDTTKETRISRFISKRSKYDRFSKISKFSMWLYISATKFFKEDKEWKEDYTFYRLPFGTLHTTIDTNNYDLPTYLPKYQDSCFLAINGLSISASVDFASWFKRSKRGLILGEECMGPVTGTCGNPVAVKLKNTNVSFISSSMRSYAGNGFEINIKPIIPDILIQNNLNSYRDKIDPVLEYFKNNIRK